MVKRSLKRLFEKIYQIGQYEANSREKKERQLLLEKLATIHPEANADQATISNHWLAKEKIVIGRKSQVKGQLEVSHKNASIIIGEHSYVGPGSMIYCADNITIGDRVLISHNVNIYDNNSHPINSDLRHKDFLFIFDNGYQSNEMEGFLKAKKIIIHDDVWIGFNSTILKGVTIGKGAIIGACTLVTQDIEPFSIVAGNPARIIGTSQ